MVLVGSTAGATAATDERIQAFRSLCIDHPKDASATTAAAEAAGWQAVESADSAELSDLLEQIVDADAGEEAVAYRAKLAGSASFLVVKTYDDGAGTYFEDCGIYDFSAAKPFGRNDLTAWLGAPEDKGMDSRWGLSLYWRGPSAIDADWEINLTYNPPDGTMNSIDGFTGAAVVSHIRPADFGQDSEAQ